MVGSVGNMAKGCLMKKRAWISIAVAFACALCLALIGCGSGGGATDGGNMERTPEANIDPNEIEPGMLAVSDDVTRTSDLWHVDGDASKGGVYFVSCSSDLGVLSVYFVDDQGKETESTGGSEPYNQVKDKHLVSSDGVEPAYDFSFEDPFTCYDNLSKTWYVRGDKAYEDVKAAFAGKSWGDSFSTFNFAEDGTFEEDRDGTVFKGKWVVSTPNVVSLFYDGDSSPMNLRFTLDSQGAIESIK